MFLNVNTKNKIIKDTNDFKTDIKMLKKNKFIIEIVINIIS